VRVHVLVAQLQHAAAEMFDARKAVEHWRASYDAVSHAFLQHLSSCGRGISVSAAEGVRRVEIWCDAAMAHSGTLLDEFAAGVLSLEASRAGQAWDPGACQPIWPVHMNATYKINAQSLSSCGRKICVSVAESVRGVELWCDAAMAPSGTLLDEIVAGVLSL
jgi:hypothetical protein